MIKGKLNVSGLNNLQKHIDYIKKLKTMVNDKAFQTFIQNKCLETVKRVALERLSTSNSAEGGNTDAEYIEEYNNRHKIREDKNGKGFILYNDFTIPQSMLPIRSKKLLENYPNGFNIAMAFEYGIGIVGENANTNPNAWEYNVNNHNFYWTYEKYGEVFATYGYAGFEIYRFTAIEIQKLLPSWVKEYFKG